MMVKFEGFERREAKLQQFLQQESLQSLEQAQEICQQKGLDIAAIVKGIQPICFDNACWAYTLGAALAIPARMRMFDWLKRYRECGEPCQVCAKDCMVQAIHPTGEINPNECVNCLNCQVNYQSKTVCPVVIKQLKRRETAAASPARNIGGHPNAAKIETSN